MSKISGLPELTEPADDDELEILDVSDTSIAETGRNKRISKANLVASAPPADHAAEHQNGGGDEIDVTGLSGVLADPQVPITENVQDIVGAMLVGGEYDDGAGTLRVGYLEIPQNPQSADYTAVLSDQAKHLYHPAGDDNPRTFSIPANASVAFRVGTALTFVNKINTLTIAITSDTLTWAEDGTTGSRSLAANGIATALKITSTEWLISGTGLS